MDTPKIRGKAILIGYNPDNQCVYSDILDLPDYYDGEHVWDRAESIQELRLSLVKGFLFDSAGNLDQEFESNFDLQSGVYQHGRIRYADGTEHAR